MGIRDDLKADVRQDVKMKKGFLQATNYLNSHLNTDEVPIYRAHLSWIPVFVRQVPFMIIGGIVGGIAWGVTNDFLLGIFIQLVAWAIGAIAQIGQIYHNISTDILLTNQGIHSKRKLFAVEDDQFARYQYINDAELSYNSIFQRLLEYGDIEIITMGGRQSDDNSDYVFKCLAKPAALKAAVRAAQNKYNSNASMPIPSQGQMGGPGIGGMNSAPVGNMGRSGRNRQPGNRRRGSAR